MKVTYGGHPISYLHMWGTGHIWGKFVDFVNSESQIYYTAFPINLLYAAPIFCRALINKTQYSSKIGVRQSRILRIMPLQKKCLEGIKHLNNAIFWIKRKRTTLLWFYIKVYMILFLTLPLIMFLLNTCQLAMLRRNILEYLMLISHPSTLHPLLWQVSSLLVVGPCVKCIHNP